MSWIGIPLAILAAFGAPWFMEWLGRSKSSGVIQLTDSGEWFRASNRLRLVIGFGSAALVPLGLIPFFTVKERDLALCIFCGSLSGFFLLIGVAALVELSTSYVFINSDGLEYRCFWRVYKIDRDQIKGGSVLNGFLFVDLKSGKSVQIRMMDFADGRRLPYLVQDLIRRAHEHAKRKSGIAH